MNSQLEKIDDYSYKIKKSGDMAVDAVLYVNEKLAENVEERAIKQVKNVATLPGIIDRSIAMSDMHVGYGFTIGGVAAFDAKEGIISPGGIGFDINCGIRVLTTNLTKEDIEGKVPHLLDEMFKVIPCGVGRDSDIHLTHEELDKVLKNGGKWALENGYGDESDVENCEENGCMTDADPSKVSPTAKKRGKNQLGTLGAGNHFLEIQVVDEIKDEDKAKAYGITKPGQVIIMIHCGSRGLGHQTCSDYIRRMQKEHSDIYNNIQDKDLIYAPINGEVGQDYFAAMSASANFAWANRHIIASRVKDVFKKEFDCEIKTLYDVAHNICKREMYKDQEVLVHRKGATRAFGPGHKEIPANYKDHGQPVLIPGSMGTSSYILSGSKKAEENTFASTCHGAGRVMSRHEAMNSLNADKIKDNLTKHNIHLKSASKKGVVEEAPECYKDVDEVIDTVVGAGIAEVVCRLIPVGVIKG